MKKEKLIIEDELNEKEARENLILHMNNTKILRKKLKKNVKIRRILQND